MLAKHNKLSTTTVPFFPAGLPDETIGSRVSRYHIRRGRPTAAVTFRQLFDRPPFSLTTLLPPHLETLAARLPGSQAQNLTRLRAESTLLPLYQRFLGSTLEPKKSKQKKGRHVAPARRINGDSRQTHICRQCLVDDERDHGFPYIHRAHQIPGVTACWKHVVTLIDRCPSCRQPFAQPTQFVLSAWLGCECGHLLSNQIGLKEREPSEIEVDFARFTRELLEGEPVRLSPRELVRMYRRRAAEIGFGWGREKIKRKALFETIETFFGSTLLSTIDTAYRLRRVTGWLKVLENSSYDEVPLHRHLLFAYFLFRDSALFLRCSQELAARITSDHASRASDPGQSNKPKLREDPETLLRQMIAAAQRYGYESEQLWKFFSGGMKRLVKVLPNACELIDKRLRAAAARKARRSGRGPEMKERDRQSDIEWAKAINESAMRIYASDKRPYRVTMNRLIEAAEFRPKGIRLPSQERFPLARSAAEKNAESVWHFFARRMLWTLQSLHEPDISFSAIRIRSGLELHKGNAVLQYFSDVPRCGGVSAKEINAVLESREIGYDWAGPCPDRAFYRAGRAYQRVRPSHQPCSTPGKVEPPQHIGQHVN